MLAASALWVAPCTTLYNSVQSITKSGRNWQCKQGESAKELGLTDKEWHKLNALHLEAKFKRLDRSVNRYRDSIRIFAGGQIEANRSKH